MKVARLLVVVFLLNALTGLHLAAQKSPDLENGFKNYGSYDSSHLDTVNLMNGNLMLHAPLLPNYPQRGKLGLQPILAFNSKTWQVICADTNLGPMCGWFKGGTGVALQRPMDLGIQRTLDNFFTGTQVLVTAQGYSLTSADGATHQLFPTVITNGVFMEFETADTTGYHVVMSGADANGVPSIATITDRHGNRYVAVFDASGDCGALPFNPPLPWAGGSPNMGGGYAPMIDDTPRGDQFCPQLAGAPAITDSNGNVMQTYDPANNTFAGNDTLGRAIPLGQYTLTTDYSGCVSTNTIAGAYLMNYSAPDGTTRQLKMCFVQIALSTAFNQPGVVEAPGGPALPPGSNRLEPNNMLPTMATIVLADGTKWVLSYDSYGEITSVSLPTGGSISYTWTTVGIATVCQNSATQKSRAVATRTLDDGQGHISTWTYNWGTPVNGVLTNTVTDPLLNDTDHIFTALDGVCSFYETSTKSYQGSKDSGTLLKQVDTSYWPALGFTTDSGEGVIGNVVAKDITTTVYPSGKVSKIHREYDSGLGAGKPIFGNVKKELEYDWGLGTPGPLLRETDTTYQWEANSAYLTAHLLDLPATVIVKDAGNTRVAETDYTYDEAAYLTASGVTTQHNSGPPAGVRGNQTTVSRWLNTTNSFIASHTNWYDTGQVFKTIDALGHTTTFSYDAFYKGAYPTQTCSPQTGSVTHCVSGTYDFNTGVLTSLTNENASTQASGNTPGDGPHTSNFSYDYLFRITSAQAPPDPANSGLRAQTSFAFSSPGVLPITVQRTKSITTVLSDSATNFFDGLARGYRGQHVLPNGTATVDTTFDADGRVATVSNPYFTTSDPTYGITTSTYDGLDRATQTTKQDGSISSVAYSVVTGVHDAVPGANFAGDCNDATDEAGKIRRACSDALGRLVLVVEPNQGATATTATGAITINGNEQTTPTATAGSATVTIGGEELADTVDSCQDLEPPRSCPHTIYDSGSVLLTVNSHTNSTGYGRNDTAQSVASGLAAIINGDSGAFVTASASGTTITLTARTSGSSTNYTLSGSAGSNDPANFGAGSFFISPTSGALAGGHNAGMPDTGTLTATVNGTNYQVSFGSGDTGTSIASRLATAMSGSTVVTAVASGNQVNLTSKTAGASGNATLSASYTWNNGLFSQASFTASTLGVAGGYDAGAIDNNPFKTFYSYDTLGNLTCVEQHGSAATGTGCSSSPSNDATSPWRVRRFTYDSLSRLLTAKNPESGTITYVYDNDGELLSKTSPAPNQTGSATQAVSFCYDELHRVTGKGYGAQSCPLATPVVTYAYDSGTNAKGHLTSLTDQPGTATYGYDILGRLITETRTLTGANNAAISKTISYTYNLDGSVTTLTYPSNKVITYAPDSAGRMLSAVDSASAINYVTGATYGPDSALTGFISGSGGATAITNAFSYNKRLQPVAMSASTASQTVFSISYDFHVGNGTSGTNNGNVFGITNYKDTTRNQTFTYDSLNRLVSAQNAGTDCNVTVLGGKKKFWGNSYGYDAWGNLLSKTVTKCSSEALSVVAGNDNRLQGAYTYDAAGNMLHDANSGLNYTWDQENRLTGANGFTYTYDGDGNRVRKSNGNLAADGTLYWYMTPGVVAETDLAGTTKSEYIFFDGERVARRDGATGTGGVFYYFSDHLKTASVITDSAGVIKAESDYYPWGGELQFVNNDSNDYKFTGKKRDVETGLDYFGARYYSNGLGRWVSADWSPNPVPVPYADFGDPQSLNLYGFVGGNPASKTDPDGHCCTLGEVVDFVGGVSQGIVASASFGAVGAPKSSDSNASLLGQALGTAIEGAVGTGLRTTGAGAVGVGLVAEAPSAGTSTAVVVTGAVGVVAGGAMEAGAAKNVGAILNAMSTRNPHGSSGAPDHQQKVGELVDKAKAEAQSGETVESNKQVKGVDSTRRPDAQIVNAEGKTRKVFEAERRPNSLRNKKREAEYKKLKLPNETHPLK